MQDCYDEIDEYDASIDEINYALYFIEDLKDMLLSFEDFKYKDEDTEGEETSYADGKLPTIWIGCESPVYISKKHIIE